LDNGDKLYMARRRNREIFRGGQPTISDAMREGIAAWAIDEVHLISIRARGFKLIGVRVIDIGDLYLAPLSRYFDRKLYKIHDYTGIGRGGSRQRLLGIQHFTCRKGIVSLSATL
ncbi:MAG: hypothetical protein ACRYGR_08650, partial [Janthinobacterium lividum]